MSEALYAGGDEHLPAEVDEEQRGKLEWGGGKAGGRVPAVEIRFEGGNVSPDKILVPDLALVVRAVQRLSAGRIPDESEPLTEDEKLRLIGVRRGSARYTFAGPAPVVAAAHLRVAGEVIANPEQIGENDYLLQPVGSLSHASAKLGCSISIREPGRGGVVLARIGPQTYNELSRSILIHGLTEFGGKVERVGGATRSRCGIRVAFQKRMLICRVPDSSVARALGENLYKRVVVSGEAAWIRTTLRVFSFRVESVRPIKDGSLFEKIQAVRVAGGSGWDRVTDVRAFLDIEERTPERPTGSADRRSRGIEVDDDLEQKENS